MKIIHLILLAISLVCGSAVAQEIPTRLPGKPDSLPPIDADSSALPSYMHPVKKAPQSSPIEHELQLESVRRTLAMPSLFAPATDMTNMAPRTFATPGQVVVRPWDGAAIAASGNLSSLPGLMNIERGQLTFSQQFGNFTLQAYASATHYGYFSGMQTAWGFGGSLNYRFNNHLSITVFGSYSTAVHPFTPAMAGYMDAPNFGVYLTYDINDRWGIDVGAQATRSLVTNRWEAQPIVMPYYKIDGKHKIGVDVGGILYNVFKNASESSNGHYRVNPTIGPPVGGPPPVAPRPDK